MTEDINDKIEAFFKEYKSVKFDKNHILISAGVNPSNIIKLQTGQVREYDISEQGDRVVVNVFKAPAFFPVSWAMNNTPNEYYFEAATEVIVKFAPRDKVIGFLKENPDVVYDLLSRVFLGTDVLLRRMAHLMGGNARTRILYELCLEGRRFGEIQKNGKCFIPMHLNELAAKSGLSRETASREIGKLKKLGIVVSRKGIYVKSLKTLHDELGNSL